MPNLSMFLTGDHLCFLWLFLLMPFFVSTYFCTNLQFLIYYFTSSFKVRFKGFNLSKHDVQSAISLWNVTLPSFQVSVILEILSFKPQIFNVSTQKGIRNPCIKALAVVVKSTYSNTSMLLRDSLLEFIKCLFPFLSFPYGWLKDF